MNEQREQAGGVDIAQQQEIERLLQRYNVDTSISNSPYAADDLRRITTTLPQAALKLDPEIISFYLPWRKSVLLAIKRDFIDEASRSKHGPPCKEEQEILKTEIILTCLTLSHPVSELWLQRNQWILDTVDQDHFAYGATFVAAFYFLQGDAEKALQKFEESRKSAPGQPYIFGLPIIFSLLARIAQGGIQNETALLEESQQLQKGLSAASPLLPILKILSDFSKITLQKITLQQSIWLHHEPLTTDHWHDLFQALALYWLEQPIEERLIRRLLRHNQQCGLSYDWYRNECSTLLLALGVERTRITPNVFEADPAAILPTLYRKKSPWKQQLNLLQSVSKIFTAGPATESNKAPNTTETRMVWLIHGEDQAIEFSPKEQRRNKKGWSKGRKVALKRLHEQRSNFNYLTMQDIEICNNMEVEHHRNYSGYPETRYSLCGENVIRAAIGHPALFFDDGHTLHGPLTIEERNAHLEVKEIPQQQQIHFAIHPYPAVAFSDYLSSFRGYFQPPNRFIITHFNDGQLAIAKILSQQGLTTPEEARQEVANTLSSMAPILSIHSDVTTSSTEVEGDTTPHLHLSPIAGGSGGFQLSIYCYPFGEKIGEKGPYFSPGSEHASIHIEIDGNAESCQRNLQGEVEAANQIIKELKLPDSDIPWQWILDDPEDALELLSTLQQMKEPMVVAWPEGKQITLLRECDSKQMSLSFSKKQEWFTLDGTLQLEEGEVIEMKKLLTLLQQRPGRFLQLDDGRILNLSQQLRRQLDRISTLSHGNRIHPLASAAIEESTQEMAVKKGRGWLKQINKIEEANTLQPALPVTLDASLRSFQLDGFEWLSRLAHWGAGGCLADDMGLGKTVQALALILQRCADGPTLVIAPTSVCNNWVDESQRFAPTINPQLFGGGKRQQMLDHAGPHSLIICSYGLLQSEIERLKQIKWQTIIADEAQAFKNSRTKRSKAMMSLQGEMRIITTGTPIENHLGELWNLFQFINPGLLGTEKQFNQRFAIPIQEQNNESARQHLKSIIQPFMLRRLKRDVLTELPPRTEIIHSIEMAPEEAAFYEALRRQSIERIAEPQEHPGQLRIKILTEITRLRQAACHPRLVLKDSPLSSAKLRAFMEILNELRENNHRALVFSQFVGHLSLIREQLDSQGIHYQYLDGSTPAKQRKIAVDAFQQGEGELFLISLKAGGAGLNLTAADYVIHMDPWWNPAVEDQASDRAHRMGQTRPVTIYRMVVQNSIEEKIIQLHQQKRDLANSLLEGSDHATPISVDDLVELIHGNQAPPT